LRANTAAATALFAWRREVSRSATPPAFAAVALAPMAPAEARQPALLAKPRGSGIAKRKMASEVAVEITSAAWPHADAEPWRCVVPHKLVPSIGPQPFDNALGEMHQSRLGIPRKSKHAEIGLLDHLVKDRGQKPLRRRTLSHCSAKIARLGGCLACASDRPPGNTVMWRGLSRLTDIAVGAIVGAKLVGN